MVLLIFSVGFPSALVSLFYLRSSSSPWLFTTTRNMSRRLGITFSFTKQLTSLFFFTIFSLFAEPPGYMTLGVRFSYANCPPSLLTYLTSHSFTFILQRHLGDMSRTYTRNFIDRICMDHLYQSIRMEI